MDRGVIDGDIRVSIRIGLGFGVPSLKAPKFVEAAAAIGAAAG